MGVDQMGQYLGVDQMGVDQMGRHPINMQWEIDWQVKLLRREKQDYSGWAPTSTKGWQLEPPRREKRG